MPLEKLNVHPFNWSKNSHDVSRIRSGQTRLIESHVVSKPGFYFTHSPAMTEALARGAKIGSC